MNNYKSFSELKEELGNNYDFKLYEMGISALKEIENLQEEIERLNNIIKEVREYITYWHYRNDFRINSFTTGVKEELLEILDKGSDKE